MREGWEIKTLGDVCEISNGSTPLRSKKEFWENGDVNWFTINDIRNQGRIINFTNQKITKEGLEKSSLRVLPPKSVLLCCTASVGEYAITNVELTTNQQFNGLIVKDLNFLLPKYLFYFSSTLKKQLLGVSGKTTIDFVSMTKVKKVKIPIPPLPVQKQIVAILDKAFTAIDQAKANIEKNIENAKELFDSKSEYYFYQLSVNNDLLPLNEVCEKIFAGGDKPKENFSKTPTEDLNIPIIANAVKDNGLYGYTNKAKVTKPSITIAARGSGTGHTEYRDYPFVPIVRLIVLTPNTDKIEVEFLMYSIKNLTISRSGSAIPQLTVPMIKSYSIPVPSKEKQMKIVESLNQLEIELEGYKTALERKKLELEELKKSILQKAFAGELTSPKGTKYRKEVRSASDSDNIITNQNPERVK